MPCRVSRTLDCSMKVSIPPVAAPIAEFVGVELNSEVNETQYSGRLFTSQPGLASL